ncbi:MAG: polysaccharide biosynthesis C-terminal domain-containing protein [Oscillospiraceae bacterium]|nr:polysaccharide biosynthesis C-terminal domain-containing protein [Oscillospiraceae bacterium]
MKKHFFLHDKAFYKSFISLTIVIALNSLITFAVNLADNIMVGRYSEIALSGVALVNQIHFVSMMIFSGVGGGIIVLGAQYWGSRQLDNIKRSISIGMKFAIGFGLLFTLATLLFPHWILHLLTSDEQVITEGMKYLRVMCWSYIIFAISNTLVMSLRSVEVTMIGTVMSIATLIINVSLNYCLIFGNFGFPALGTTGAAIATIVSRIVELIVVLVYAMVIDKKLRLNLRDIFGIDLTLLRKYVKVATPVILSGASWGFAQAAQTAILGHMSQSAIAASSI